MIFKPLVWLALAGLLSACGGGGAGVATATPLPAAPSPAPVPVPVPAPAPAPDPAHLRVLMLGNSHTVGNGLPNMLAAMLRAGRPAKTVTVEVASGILFLDQRLADSATRQHFDSQAWSAVIFQAQKYSSSGTVSYSTSEAREWVRMARAKQALPIMFPEWPRQGIPETERIFELHLSIAQAEPACVAPIPQAWDMAAREVASIDLYARDGNHSSPAGAFLSALILYATVTGDSPLGLPELGPFGIDAPTQQRLREVAFKQLQVLPARRWCPDDPML